MPPHLHPRSRMTTSLFTTTLAVSFLVVATPHLLPCPVNNRTFADSSDPNAPNSQRRRRKRVSKEDTGNDAMSEEAMRKREVEEYRAPKRECPVPKPGGLIGQVLGIKKEEPKEQTRATTLRVVERVRRTSEKEKSAPAGDGEKAKTDPE
ncbi:hypothetical protein EJ04DRAFT_516273 [Polyplosphaeria fusca]|uniref:Uncharacterized protein n=1 Tax=Polyplosphaeria fusca TaxID=682080 RepID=A0A9P4QQ82_9PLEO|nr:hypothetical protein EJ04DRAFT_516273 [Polyplosphaeria fusca]